MTETMYDVDVQKLFLAFMIQDPELFVRIQNIFNPENFDKSLVKSTKFIQEHVNEYGTLPDRTQIAAIGRTILDPIEEIREGHIEWFLTEFEQFTKRQELERAILKSAELLEKGDFGPVEALIKGAVQISLTRDMGLNYFEDPRARLIRLKSSNGQLSTGWRNLDNKLYGGFNRGEINIFCGGSGSGKSLILQNLATNWALMGLNGVYITLELSADLVGMRLDGMMTDISSKNIFGDIDNVELKVRMLAKKAGRLQIKYLPAQTPVNAIRAYVKELEVQTNEKIDFICVDYLDLMSPSGIKIDPTNLFIKDKYVTEELRNLFIELNVLAATASQLNRGSNDEVEYGHQDIAGGISKVFTADNLFGIFTSRAMREHGRYQIQLMKTRNSGGVGSKIDLNFNVDTLRITGLTEEEEAQAGLLPANNIMNKIRNTTSVSSNGPSNSSTTSTSKIQNLLDNLKMKANE